LSPARPISFLVYRLLFPLLLLVAFPFWLRKMQRREKGRSGQVKPPGYHTRMAQRFGFYEESLTTKMRGAIWLHSISVGETFVAMKLARQLRALGEEKIVISVTTATGFELLCDAAQRDKWMVPIYNPIDLRWVVTRTLSQIQPKQVVFIEGELWPNLVDLCERRSIPMALANARMSPRSERRFTKFRRLAGWLWKIPRLVFVQDAEDAARFANLGVPPERVALTGNIKFDNALADSASREAEFREFATALGFSSDDPVIVAGSTWDPEEKALVKAFLALRAEFPSLRLIIVPRHVERTDAIVQGLSPLRVTRRSSPPAVADVLVVDVTGELRDWYRLATVVFVGKSLPGISQVGGQNSGEPAALGKAVVFGPHMENFEALTRHLLEKEAAFQVADGDGLAEAFRRFLSDSTRRKETGDRAREVLEPHQGATGRTAVKLIHGSK
jgi:3-deoxy-D-manno-octulosonic-acid transferase